MIFMSSISKLKTVDAEERLNFLNEEIGRLNGVKKETEQEINTKKKELEKAKEDLDIATFNLEMTKIEIKSSKESLETRLVTLESELAEKSDKAKEIKLDLEQKIKEIEQLDSVISLKKELIGGFNNSLSSKEKEKDGLVVSCNELHQELVNLQKRKAQAVDDYKFAENELSLTEETLGRYKAEVETLVSKRDDIRREYNLEKTNFDIFKSQNTRTQEELNKKIIETEKLMQESMVKMADIDQELTQKELNYNKLQERETDLKKREQDLQFKLTDVAFREMKVKNREKELKLME